MNQPSIIPYPRVFSASAGRCDPTRVPVRENIVAKLGFVPRHVPDEAYELILAPTEIRLNALGEAGLRHGRTSLAALRKAGALDCGTIQDEPRFAWRGFMLDCSRQFYPVAEIKKLLDRLAGLKFNRFHWHLVDDQGWRLEIPALPRLTEIGAWRPGADGKPYGGFYTTAQARDIVAYAERLGITVVPEIELPGHSSAALAAYPEAGCTGQEVAVETQWGIFDKVYCVSSERARQLLETVFEEVIRVFPGRWIHLGGDEVVRTAWENCPRCQAAIREQGIGDGVVGLEAAFFRHFIAFLAQRGRTAIGWSEMFEHHIPTDVPIQWWLHPEFAQKALKAGNPLLVSNVEYCYFDYPYQASDYWNQSFMLPLPTEKVYANPVVPEGCESYIDHILGGEACLWTERASWEKIDERLDGRIEAFAEVYWSFDKRPGWESFKARLGG